MKLTSTQMYESTDCGTPFDIIEHILIKQQLLVVHMNMLTQVGGQECNIIIIIIIIFIIIDQEKM